MSRFSACLWFDTEAEKAAQFYTSFLPRSQITGRTHYTEAGREFHGRQPGSIMTVDFAVGGFGFSALNGGPDFSPNPSISFFIFCGSEGEVDRCWEALADGGTVLMPIGEYPFSRRYGWIEDRFGVSWQPIVADDADGRLIVPSMLFTGKVCGKAEEAIGLYTTLFPDSEVGEIARYPASQPPDREGTIMYADFRLESQWFAVMDSALDHKFGFNEGISLMVDARTQDEIDRLWSTLSADPQAEQCGWLKDRYGVSWQIFPVGEMNDMLRQQDRAAVQRVMNAMFQMKKIDLAALRRAFGDAT